MCVCVYVCVRVRVCVCVCVERGLDHKIVLIPQRNVLVHRAVSIQKSVLCEVWVLGCVESACVYDVCLAFVCVRVFVCLVVFREQSVSEKCRDRGLGARVRGKVCVCMVCVCV